MIGFLIFAVLYLVIGTIVTVFIGVLEEKHPRTLFQDIYGVDGKIDSFCFICTLLVFPLAICLECAICCGEGLRHFFEKIIK